MFIVYTVTLFGTKDVTETEHVETMRAEVERVLQSAAHALLSLGHHTLGANIDGKMITLPHSIESESDKA